MELDAGDEPRETVEEPRRRDARQRVLAVDLPAADEIGAGVEPGEHARDLGGIVLQVAVHRDQTLAAGGAEPDGQRRRLAEIRPQAESARARIARLQRDDLVE